MHFSYAYVSPCRGAWVHIFICVNNLYKSSILFMLILEIISIIFTIIAFVFGWVLVRRYDDDDEDKDDDDYGNEE